MLQLAFFVRKRNSDHITSVLPDVFNFSFVSTTKALNGLSPAYLTDFLKCYNSSQALYSPEAGLLLIPGLDITQLVVDIFLISPQNYNFFSM